MEVGGAWGSARTLRLTRWGGFKLVVPDVIDDGGEEFFARQVEFYRRLGFQSLEDRPERMFITISTIRAMFGEG